jgi:hypothetical protein
MKMKWLKVALCVPLMLCLLVSLTPTPALGAPGNDKTQGNGQSQDKKEDKPEEKKDDSHDKVTVCHRGHTLEISRNALEAHLNHGDTLGPCNVTPSQNR